MWMLTHVSPWPMQPALQAILETDSISLLIWACVIGAVITPISEELLFRGLLQPALQRWAGPWAAISLGAAFFSLAHMDLFAAPSMLVLGLALGYVYYRTRSLVAPFLLHAAHNTLVLMLFVGARTLPAGF